ncbi:MAG: GNAT family N-acetyltransferase, partial [Candidatus Shapirobacteria bacterium]
VIIGAFVEKEVIGIGDISLGYGATNHVGDFGITVAKKFRGEGIGKKLMELVIQKSIENIKDLKIITLEVFGNNPIAQNLYKKMGFIEYGRLPGGLKRQGEFVDEILMYKKIK